jgi:hypothetical protein
LDCGGKQSATPLSPARSLIKQTKHFARTKGGEIRTHDLFATFVPSRDTFTVASHSTVEQFNVSTFSLPMIASAARTPSLWGVVKSFGD